MVNLIVVVFCILAGMAMRRGNVMPPDAHKAINIWILYFALPAVSFKYIPQIIWSVELLFPILAAFTVWIGAWFYTNIYNSSKKYNSRTVGAFKLGAGLSNTSFIGFPLVVAFLGEEYLPIAIIFDQTTFFILSTLGVATAIKAQNKLKSELDYKFLFKKLIQFPPLICCLIALGLNSFLPLNLAGPFFDKLAVTVGPLALFSIGLQMKFEGWKKYSAQINVALLYKLIFAPLLILILAIILGIRSDIARVSVLEAAMPTLVTSSIIAQQYGLNTKLINLIIGVGISVSIITITLWSLVISKYI